LNFLNPALLPLLFAAALPAIIHLLNRQRRRNIDFSTLKFLKKLEKKRMRRVKIAEWLILILRTLAVFFVILAFTRPVLESPTAAFSGESATAAVLMLDNSIASGFNTARGSVLSLTVAQAAHVLNVFSIQDRVMVMGAAAPAKLAIPYPLPGSDDRLRRALFELASTDSHPDWISAFKQAEAILAETGLPNREIYLFSTFSQEHSGLDSAAAELPENIRLFILPYELKKSRNFAVTALRRETEIMQKGGTVTFSIDVENYSPVEEKSAVLNLFDGDEREASAEITLPAGKKTTVEMRMTLQTGGFHQGRVRLEAEDDLPADNIAYYAFYTPEQVEALIIGERPAAKVIETAINPGEKREYGINARLAISLADIEKAPASTVIIIIGGGDYSSYFASALKQRLQAGGGAIILPGENIDMARFNRDFLQILGLPRLLELKEFQDGMRWQRVDYRHPLFQGIFSGKAEAESPAFKRYFSLTEKVGREIISLPDGNSLLREVTIGKGKVLFFTSGVTSYWSDFAFKGIFSPLLHRSVIYLTADRGEKREGLVAGRELEYYAAPELKDFHLKLPDGNDYDIMAEGGAMTQRISYSLTEKAGFYQLFAGAELLEVFPVNPAAGFLPVTILPEKGKSIILKTDEQENLADLVHSARLGKELWQWFLILGIICLIAEMGVVKLMK